MGVKPVRLRQLAASDLEVAADQYLAEAGDEVAVRFVDAVASAIGRIGRTPGLGSLRFSHELDIAELRAWPLGRFPYIVFYVDGADHVDVWRILHASRHIPPTLGGDPGSPR